MPRVIIRTESMICSNERLIDEDYLLDLLSKKYRLTSIFYLWALVIIKRLFISYKKRHHWTVHPDFCNVRMPLLATIAPLLGNTARDCLGNQT